MGSRAPVPEDAPDAFGSPLTRKIAPAAASAMEALVTPLRAKPLWGKGSAGLPPTAPAHTTVVPASPARSDVGDGEGVTISDKILIEMLRQRPKQVPMLRSRESFRRFFQGIGRSRMETLLHAAYSGLEASDREDKVSKRLVLLDGVLT